MSDVQSRVGVIWHPGSLKCFLLCGDRLYTSESDVYRRQILTYKDNPRTESVNENVNVLFICRLRMLPRVEMSFRYDKPVCHKHKP